MTPQSSYTDYEQCERLADYRDSRQRFVLDRPLVPAATVQPVRVSANSGQRHDDSVSARSQLVSARGQHTVGAIIQTLTLATVLLMIGVICLAVGTAGFVWSARRDRERMERQARSVPPVDDDFHQPVT
jgi:hypothetical protein